MEKIAREFEPLKLIKYLDDIPIIANSIMQNKPEDQKKNVNKPVQSSIEKKTKEVEKRAAGEKSLLDNMNDLIGHSPEKRKMLKKLMRRAIEEAPENARVLGPLMNKPLETLSDADKLLIAQYTNAAHVNLKRKPKMVKDWTAGSATVAPEVPKPKIEPQVPKGIEKAPQAIAKAKLPLWAKALIVAGGAGLAGLAGYGIYRASKKKKPLEKTAKTGVFSAFIDRLLKDRPKEYKKKFKKVTTKQRNFIRSKIREM